MGASQSVFRFRRRIPPDRCPIGTVSKNPTLLAKRGNLLRIKRGFHREMPASPAGCGDSFSFGHVEAETS
jgi:hypothetical protein